MYTCGTTYISNSDSNMLPSDGETNDPEKYLNRVGMIMEKVGNPAVCF